MKHVSNIVKVPLDSLCARENVVTHNLQVSRQLFVDNAYGRASSDRWRQSLF